MKVKLIGLIGLFFFGFSTPSEAQIFKKLKKKVEQKVNERIDRKEREADAKVDQKIDEGMDKVEHGTEDAVLDWINGSDDEAGAEEASSSESGIETPTAATPQGDDYTIEATGSGPDIFMQYRMDVDSEQMKDMPSGMGDFDMSLKIYSSPRLKRSRSDVVTKIPIVGKMQIATISNLEDQDHIIMINDKKKTYAIVDAKNDEEQEAFEDYTIEVVGKEVLHGLNTTRFKITSEDLEGFVFEMWTSKDIPGYQKMLDIYKKSGQMGNNKIWDKIIKADADGFVVRMEGGQEGVKTRLELQDIQELELSSSLFQIPSNYKKKKSIAAGLF